MIHYNDIEQNLILLDNLNQQNYTNQRIVNVLSKAAALELSGWIENTIDNIILPLAQTRFSNYNYTYLSTLVKQVHGFSHDNHFRKLLIYLIGIKGFENMLSSINAVNYNSLKADLTNHYNDRKDLAHNHIIGITPRIVATSTTLTRFYNILHGLQDIDSYLTSNL